MLASAAMANPPFGAVHAVAATEVPWLPGLIAHARAVVGQPPFSDGSLVDLASGARAVLVIDDVAVALAAFPEAEFVVAPDARRQGLGASMLEALILEASMAPSESDGEGTLLVWAHGDHPGARALAASHGFTAVRRLLHLRADVAQTTALSAAAPVESFRPGTDDAEWLALNALVFADHPEQGSVNNTDLEILLGEPWFIAEDFLLLRDGDQKLIGYCWLKVDTEGEVNDTAVRNGEFYVVGVNPDHHGRGLGRVLVEAGLERLRARNIRSAHLYVEAENLAAVRLYRSYGFVDDTIDVQYARTVPRQSAQPAQP
jgi:mycothiol synthase